MRAAIDRLTTKLTSFVRNLPRTVVWAASVLILVGIGAAALYGYRMYNYVQHDNDFCMSCHLMQDPYERFAKSQHRGLGCKACHQPTPVARAKMALTQILENPEQLREHAEVPNERCEECHVKGNPAEWILIASSAGHRVHLESKDPKLQGLQCVQCHSSSVHEFAATDKTCAQSECHTNVKIQLGKMGKLTLHCAVCHDFNKPVAKQAANRDSLGTALQPREQECLACHAMRQRFKMPATDPHNGACGACHNPHDQATPRDAQNTCTSCHDAVETVSPMHKGLGVGVLAQCASCHRAHDFKVQGTRCLDCHRDIFDDGPGTIARASPSAIVRPVSVLHATPAPQSRDTLRFRHSRHRQLDCLSCHTNERRHGELKITAAVSCQSCHHGTQAAANCTNCHTAAETAKPLKVSQRFAMSVGAKTRDLTFDHDRHKGVACAQCHRDPLTRSAEGLQCKSCHANHHKPTDSCMSCHPPASRKVHTAQVHLGCAGSECHKQLPVPGVPRTRQFCLACHQTMVNHKPAGNCADCHRLPAPRGTS